jgi:hypothetical protein
MYRLAISSYKQEQQIAYRISNVSINVPVQEQRNAEGIYKLVKDSAAFIPEQQIRGGNLVFNVPPDLEEAGFYDLLLQDKSVATFAFNYNKQESLLEQYSPDELKSF